MFHRISAEEAEVKSKALVEALLATYVDAKAWMNSRIFPALVEPG